MYISDGRKRFFWLTISIILNSAANALTVATNMGSAVWTASAVNLSHLILHTTNPAIANHALGLVLVMYGIVVAFLDLLLLGRFDLWRLVRNILFIVPFSYLIQFIVPFWSDFLGIKYLHASIGHPLQLGLLIALDMLGLAGVAVAVSLYQRANLIMHPNDDLSYIIRFKYLKGIASLSQWISYIPPIAITIICFLGNQHQLWAFNFGTIWAFLTQGYVQGWSDQHIVPSFKHHFSGNVGTTKS